MTPYTPLGRRQLTPLAQARRRAGNGLLNNLIAYWPGNEAAGNALDLHTNALHLADVNTVTSNPGLVYPLARQYTAANSEHHVRPGDDALLSGGDVDLTIASLVRFDTLTSESIATKYQTAAIRDYGLWYSVWTANRFSFTVRNTADTAWGDIPANTFGLPVINTWYLVVAWHDSVANTLNIQINNGVIDSLVWAGGISDSAAPFAIGCWRPTIPPPLNCFNGRIGPTMFWKSNPGLGGVLTAAQRTALWAGGAGLPYASFTT